MSALAAEAAPNVGYRVRLATLLPALQLAYFVLIWPLTYAGNIVTADLASGPLPQSESFLLNRLFFPAVAVVSLLLLVAERRQLGRFHLVGLVLGGGFFVYLGLTGLWALAPAVTLSKFVLLGMQVLGLAVPVLLARRVDELLLPMFVVMGVTLVVNLVAVAIIPRTPIGYAGIYSHKNTLGEVAALAGLFAFYGVLQGRRVLRVAGIAMLGATLLLLYLSQSKTSLGLFLVCPVLALLGFVVHRALRVSLAVLLVVGSIPVAFVLAGGVSGLSFHDVSIAVTGDGTFTGRTELWDFALHHIAQRPLLGYGYQSFWGIGFPSPQAGLPDGFLQRAPHAHNGYLDLLIQGGAVALGLFVLLLLLVARWTDRLSDANAAAGFFVIAMLLFLIVLNLLETVWMQGLSPSSMLATLFILVACSRRDGKVLT